MPQGSRHSALWRQPGIPNSTLSHQLEKLKNENLAKVRRESTFLWYTGNAEALEELLDFLYAVGRLRRRSHSPRCRWG